MPDVSALPGWIWRKLGRRGRAALGVAVLAVLAVLAVAIPAIDEDKQRTRKQDASELAARQARTAARLRVVQRPHRASLGGSVSLTRARAGVEGRITADVRDRQQAGELPARPAVITTRCAPVSTARGERLRRAGVDHLRCLAVTSENATVASGHEFIAATRPATGRVVWCRTTALPGEKFNAAATAVVRPDAGCYRP